MTRMSGIDTIMEVFGLDVVVFVTIGALSWVVVTAIDRIRHLWS